MVSHLLGIPVRLGYIGLQVGWWRWKRSGRWRALTQAQLDDAYAVRVNCSCVRVCSGGGWRVTAALSAVVCT